MNPDSLNDIIKEITYEYNTAKDLFTNWIDYRIGQSNSPFVNSINRSKPSKNHLRKTNWINPHQGECEKARRRRQMAKHQLVGKGIIHN